MSAPEEGGEREFYFQEAFCAYLLRETTGREGGQEEGGGIA